MNLNQTHGEASPNLNIGVISYGRFKNQPDFSVGQIGVGFSMVSQVPQVVVTPVAYNIGQHVPLLNNTYIAPSVHVDSGSNFSIMVGMRVGL